MPNYFTNLLISPAPFKGLLFASSAAEAIKTGILLAQPSANVKVLPMADGGMGTVSAVYDALGGDLIELEVCGPYGEIRSAKYVLIGGGDVAVIEMASAAGFIHAPDKKLDPMHATTGGVGRLIADAARRGCKKIIVGLGDSATVDLGLGMMSELGAKFFDSSGAEVVPIPDNFSKIDKIDMSGISHDLIEIEFFGYADVANSIVSGGGSGAIRIFGPQKGVTTEVMPKLESGVDHIVSIMEENFEIKLRDEPMTGAAGGLGVSIMAFLKGSLVQGSSAIAVLIGLEEQIKSADLVITGEGRLDKQSLLGKVVSEVASHAIDNGKLCWAVVGKNEDPDVAKHCGIETVIEISPDNIPSSSKEAFDLIRKAVAEKFASLLK
jgi:glycerate kinase